MEDSNPELESFRRQWRAEVSARTKSGEGNKPAPAAAASRAARRPSAAPQIAAGSTSKIADEEEEHAEPGAFHDLGHEARLEDGGKSGSREPRSALEHYEKGVERETQGSLGDSLDHYRKAFKLDNRVDLAYKNKHFPPSYFASKATNSNPSNAPVTVPNTAHHSLDGPPPTIKELIAGFSGLSIEPAPPAVEGDPALPCPLATLPGEILVHIFRELAIIDVASFARLAQVCKHMAYVVATEEAIWRRVCQGAEVGFGGMHYEFQVELLGSPLEDTHSSLAPSDPPTTSDPLTADTPPTLPPATLTLALLHSLYSSSWRQMFRQRPRVRFNGCYISTNNYIRPGQAAPSTLTWSSPVHIVTYYRYLRLLRDGSAISLLTTAEPADVVPHLTPALLAAHRHHAANPHLPSAVMQHALRGRWRLLPAREGELVVETEGVGPKYMYRQDLALRSAGRGARNNKLVWGAYWFYNRLTDDWAEFSRKNEKPFFWSRVRSYGSG